jgi:RHS repeat-associated protein
MVNQVPHANGVTDTYGLDANAMQRPAAIASSRGGTSLWSTGSYRYDGAGDVAKIGGGWYTYDRVSRLASATFLDGPTGGGAQKSQSYTFDPFGNLISIAGTVGRSIPVSPATNRLNAAGVAYDTAGNLQTWNGATYEWDAFNQMRHMVNGAEDWTYMYTADDERLWSFKPAMGGNPRVDRFTLRGLDGKVLREAVTSGYNWATAAVEDYVYRDGQLLAAETASGVEHFHLDHLGTPRLITNGSGIQTAYHVYYPFGEEATAFNQDAERMKFTGHERDLNSLLGAGDDLDSMHARFCSPVTGRFLSTDRVDVANLQLGDFEDRRRFAELLRRPGSWNRYVYAESNPLKYVDPDGKAAELAIPAELWLAGEGGGAAGGGLAAGVGPLLLAAGAGVALGYGVNQIPGVSEALTFDALSEALANVFLSGAGEATRNFINTKVSTVLQHIATYTPPDPNDDKDRGNKRNIYNRMKDQLKQAREKLKRLPGDRQRQAFEELIRRTEEQLENWWSGGAK